MIRSRSEACALLRDISFVDLSCLRSVRLRSQRLQKRHGRRPAGIVAPRWRRSGTHMRGIARVVEGGLARGIEYRRIRAAIDQVLDDSVPSRFGSGEQRCLALVVAA